MSKKNINDKKLNSKALQVPTNEAIDSYATHWNLDSAWITGLAGVITTLTCAVWFQQANILNKGIQLFGTQITSDKQYSMLCVLITVCAVMFIVASTKKYLE